jgi:hypothetical protein
MIKELTFLKENKIKTMTQTVPTTTGAVLPILIIIILQEQHDKRRKRMGGKLDWYTWTIHNGWYRLV